MIPDKTMTCLGLEYFCTEGDDLWNMPEIELVKLGTEELVKLGLLDDFSLVVDGIVLKTPRAYPVYDAVYKDSITKIREYLSGIKNLQTIGRGGQHRYNNMDHSMLTGVYAARNLVLGTDYDIWTVNIEKEYHEETAGRQVP